MPIKTFGENNAPISPIGTLEQMEKTLETIDLYFLRLDKNNKLDQSQKSRIDSLLSEIYESNLSQIGIKTQAEAMQYLKQKIEKGFRQTKKLDEIKERLRQDLKLEKDQVKRNFAEKNKDVKGAGITKKKRNQKKLKKSEPKVKIKIL